MTTTVKVSVRFIVTAAVILVAVVAVLWKFWDYAVNPWTRNGQVFAQVIQVTPRVSGTIVELPVVDNQFVKAGDLLFRIDPRTYESDLHEKEAILDKVKDEIEALEREVEAKAAAIRRFDALIEQARSQIAAFQASVVDTRATFRRMRGAVKSGAVSQDQLDEAKAEFDFASARLQNAKDLVVEHEASKLEAEAEWERAKADLGAAGTVNARLRAAKAAVHHAELELEFTEVRALVDGYVTNLNLRLGDHATANHALMALVDVNSYWISGFFKESALHRIDIGDRAVVTLMGYPGKPIQGRVNSIGWGVAQEDGSADSELLPKISATFEWIRLAQRVPVRVEFDELPEDVKLVVGTTASVLVVSGTSEGYEPKKAASVPAAPRALH